MFKKNDKDQDIFFKGRRFHVSEVITTGMTSVVYKTDCGHVIKKFHKDRIKKGGHFEREHFWLKKLTPTGIVPCLIDVDTEEYEFLMEDAGEPCMTSSNIPEDWRKQIEHILKTLKEHNCKHNDLSEQEVLVKNNIIKIIDFSFASMGDDITCGGRFSYRQKNRIYSDEYIINLLSFLLEPCIKGTELHDFVLWDNEERKEIEEEIKKSFTIIQAITYSPQSLMLLGRDRVEVLTQFYHGRISDHGQKGKTPFVVFVVLDTNPVYEKRENIFNGSVNTVNINTFDLLQRVRRGRTGIIHGSDNIQESYENLQTLTFYNQNIPACYWHAWRPEFESFGEFFEALNAEDDLEYVVLRNFEDLNNDTEPDPTQDIDMLVNDYFLFKRITGALSYKHKRPKYHPHAGPAFEYGGYKVAGKVSIRGCEISVDIRMIGDNYYDAQWERDILRSRVIHEEVNFYVPNATHHFFSLLYHALVHKRYMSPKYRIQLTSMAKSLNLNLQERILDDKTAWELLDDFMEKRGYMYVRPDELTLPFNARLRCGVTVKDDMAVINQMITDHQYIQASHLVKHVLHDDPYNIKAWWWNVVLWIRLVLEDDRFLPLKIPAVHIKNAISRSKIVRNFLK